MLPTRYINHIIKSYKLNDTKLKDLYMSIKESTRFRLEIFNLERISGPHEIVLNARCFDYIDDSGNCEPYRYFLLTNDDRRRLIEKIEKIIDPNLKNI